MQLPKVRNVTQPVRLAFVVGLSFVAGCGGGDGGSGSGTTIANQNLSGKIGGQAWSLATAQSNSFLSTTDRYFVDMYPTAFTACQAFAQPTDVNLLIVDLPKVPGSYNLSLAMNATFYDATTSDNLVATRGRIVIDTVTATTVTGGANITYNANNTVDGQFQVSICP